MLRAFLVTILVVLLFPLQSLLDAPQDWLFNSSIALAVVHSVAFLIGFGPALQGVRIGQVTPLAHSLLWTAAAIPMLHTVTVLFGAPLYQQVEKTWAAAAFIAFLSVFPSAQLVAAKKASWTQIFSMDSSPECRGVKYALALSIVGAWFGGFMMPLDRSWRSKVWPIPVVLGSLAGNLVGATIGTLMECAFPLKKGNKS